MKPQRFLGIETSQEWLGICLWEGSAHRAAVKAVFSGFAQNRHSDWIIPRMHSLLARLHWSLKDLNAIAVDVGPGSFTGVRIGMTVAKTLGQFLGLPVLGIPSLDIIAGSVANIHVGDVFVCSERAIPGEVYAGAYTVENMSMNETPPFKKGSKIPAFHQWSWFPGQNAVILKRLFPLAWISEDEFERRLKSLPAARGHLLQSGRGWRTGGSKYSAPNLNAFAQLSHWSWRYYQGHTFDEIAPLYLQPSWAERRFSKVKIQK